MIRKDLLEFQYYLDRLSKFMQESYGIDEQVRMFHSLLKQVNDVYDEFFNELDFVKNPDVEIKGDLLDKIGSLFGCHRAFTIPVYNPINPLKILSYTSVDLTDKEFLTYIECSIAKQNFNGTRKNLQKLYTTWINQERHQGLIDLEFIYFNYSSPATCFIYWNTANQSDNMTKLFKNGYLTIESMGIIYTRTIVNMDNFGHYFVTGDDPETYNYYAEEVYEKLASEPASGTYYNITIANNSSSTWDSTKVYATVDGDDLIVQSYEPDNFATLYSNYKILTITTATTWDADHSYKYVVTGGIFA